MPFPLSCTFLRTYSTYCIYHTAGSSCASGETKYCEFVGGVEVKAGRRFSLQADSLFSNSVDYSSVTVKHGHCHSGR